MRIWLGPIPITWEAKHFDFDSKIGFTDMQTSGPMKFWIHRHEIKYINDRRSVIEDKIWYQHYKGIKGLLSRIFFSKTAKASNWKECVDRVLKKPGMTKPKSVDWRGNGCTPPYNQDDLNTM